MRRGHGFGRGSLLARVGVAVRTLDWNIVKPVSMSEAVRWHGRRRAFQSFGILLAVFSSARTVGELQRLCGKIVRFHRSRDAGDMVKLLIGLSSASRGALVPRQAVALMIKAYAAGGKVEKGLDLLKSAQKSDVEVDVRASNFLLKCLIERGEKDQAERLFAEMKESGPSPNLFTFNIMVSLFCRKTCLDLEKARGVLAEMERKGLHASEVTHCSYLQGLCHGGELESAWEFLRELVNRKLPCNTHCFNTVLHGFCRRDQLFRARDVIRLMRERKLPPDLYSYSILIDAMCRRGDVIEGIDLFEQMESEGIEPSLVSYSSILHGLCQIGRMDRAVGILQRMKYFDAISYAIVLGGLCREGNFSYAHELFEEMTRRDLKPDAFHYNSLISCYSRAGLAEESAEVLRLMKLNGVPHGPVTCTILADGLIKRGLPQESIRIVDEHRRSCGIINEIINGVLMNGFCRARRIGDAWAELKSMENSGSITDVVIYSTLIEGFVRGFRLDEAFGLLGRMQKRGISPNVITLTSLMNGLCKEGKIREAALMFEKLERVGIRADVAAFTLVIGGLCRAGYVAAAWRFYEMMTDRSIVPDAVALRVLINGFRGRIKSF